MIVFSNIILPFRSILQKWMLSVYCQGPIKDPRSSRGLDTLKCIFSHFLELEIRINPRQIIHIFIFQGQIIYFAFFSETGVFFQNVQTSGRQVQELEVCTVRVVRDQSRCCMVFILAFNTLI